MKLPKQSHPVIRNSNGAHRFSGHSDPSIIPQAAASFPGAIATVLAEEFSTNQIDGSIQCIATIGEILNLYDQCVARGTVNCAKIAARQIKDIACKSYCTCK